MAYKYLRISREDGVLVVTIDRPPANAIDLEMVNEISDLAGLISDDQSIKAAVLASANEKIFLAGADIKLLGQLDGEQGVEFIGALHRAYDKFEAVPKPTIAAINGYAMGGGLELTLVCDFRFMADEGAYLGFPEINLGLFPAGGGTQRLPRLIGKARSIEMLMEGSRLGAAEASQIGLVNKVCKRATLLAESISFGKEIASGPSQAFRLIKDCVNRGLEVDLASGLAIEKENFRKLLQSRDAKEGIAAFIEKRKPVFKGM